MGNRYVVEIQDSERRRVYRYSKVNVCIYVGKFLVSEDGWVKTLANSGRYSYISLGLSLCEMLRV